MKDCSYQQNCIFFCYVAGIVKQFLKEYQTDISMIPFLYFDLKAVIRGLLDIVNEPVVIEACRSGLTN